MYLNDMKKDIYERNKQYQKSKTMAQDYIGNLIAMSSKVLLEYIQRIGYACNI